jgi:hypothetical protein
MEKSHDRLHRDVAILVKHQQETDQKMTELKSELKSVNYGTTTPLLMLVGRIT